MLFADDSDPNTIWGVVAGIVAAIIGPGGFAYYYLKQQERRRKEDREEKAARRRADNELLDQWKEIADLFQKQLIAVQKELQDKNTELAIAKVKADDLRKRNAELEEAVVNRGPSNA